MYKRLKVDFEIPEVIEESIDAFLHHINFENGNLADCYMEDMRSTLNGCELYLTPEQIRTLKRYYCNGEIFKYGKVDD